MWSGTVSMVTVWIPALMRDLTGGESQVSVSGETVRELIENLEERYPGMEARLCEEGRVRPNISVVVDGRVSNQGLRQKLTDGSEVHFLPAISGG
jgi:molybdopterin synthase sulfur carrier subunit